jgi:hypothetical protein
LLLLIDTPNVGAHNIDDHMPTIVPITAPLYDAPQEITAHGENLNQNRAPMTPQSSSEVPV